MCKFGVGKLPPWAGRSDEGGICLFCGAGRVATVSLPVVVIMLCPKQRKGHSVYSGSQFKLWSSVGRQVAGA